MGWFTACNRDQTQRLMRLPIIPFNRPLLAPRSLEHTRKAFLGHHISGNGPYGKRCEAWLQRKLQARQVLLTTS